MKKVLLIAFLFFSFGIIMGQQLSMQAGKNISSFDYKNSQGIQLENLQSTNNTFINLGYRKSIFSKYFFLNAKALYNSYAATGSNRILDNYYEWNTSYLGPSLGLEYEIARTGNFIFSLKIDGSAEFLIQGTQTINNQVYNLYDEEDFDSAIYFLRGGAKIQYVTSDRIAVFMEYAYGQSGSFSSTTGDLKIGAHNFGLGLLINVSKKTVTQSSIDTIQLNQLKLETERNSQKIKELEDDTAQLEYLEQKNAEKEHELESLKESISEALQPYSGNDLLVEDREGKVYITLDNDMLFKSGSWKVNKKGEETIATLGEVLSKNSDLNIQVEGHTDNKAFKENKMTNWELSTKRASAIVQLLSENKAIDPENLTVAGKGEFNPVASNDTEEGRAQNRRIEIIISPNLEEIAKIIND